MSYIYSDEDNSPMCENCIDFDTIHGACMKDWNNLDIAYYAPDRDNRKPDEVCEDWRNEK